jgi:hypothetical protein
MAFDSLEQLTRFMEPYYQAAGDQTLLQDYLDEYQYAECAAAALWNELLGKAGLAMKGTLKIDTGAEKFVYSEPGTMQLACQRAANLYTQRCDDIKGQGSCAIRVSKATVGGVEEAFGR